MRKLFSLFVAVCLCSGLYAQSIASHKLIGIIKDSATAKGIPMATITLLQKDKNIATAATDTLGSFELQKLLPGKYSLQISSISYQSLILPVTILGDTLVHDLGSIQLSLQKGTVGSVTVTGLKALIEDKGDRLVYNAEKDISNAGGTAADVLRKVPSLTVDLDGNVQMRGNGNIKVLINGKPSAMMARNLADALKQMPANIIKTIEVITSPGAKYDAEGSAGVINIITKKGLQGFNGSANAAVGNFNRGVGTNLNYKKNKIGISMSANMYQYRNVREGSISRTTLQNGQPL
ncbi:MAG TPA: carboxypeptidase regulatory-like domain-containing protein, partial [Segetibacter sp.]